jgi:uncharacterized protein YndB with AHSA1/START domain
VAKGTSSAVDAPPDRTLVVTRVFDAPRELVYRAWTDAKEFGKWFPPLGFSAARCELDVRPGGTLRIDMKGGDDAGEFAGVVFPGKGVYREVVPNERLSFTFEGEDAASQPQLLMTVVFEDEGRKTKLTIYQVAKTVADYEELLKIGATEGLGQSLDKLASLLEGGGTSVVVKGRTLTIARVYDAPRELVWQAYTDPKQIVKWMFAKDWEAPFAETDVRRGGAFRIGMRPADHSEEGFTFDGTYREVVKPERLVQDLSDGRVMTATFEELKGKTKLTISVEMAESEEQERTGYGQILENLAKHIATLTGRKK